MEDLMRKIRLDLDTLSVESFSTVRGKEDRDGTVFGHLPPFTYQLYCSDGNTCYETCDGCGTAPSDCGTCDTNCGTCATDCGTCDPYCCCTCSCA
jgi:hypothetical protein